MTLQPIPYPTNLSFEVVARFIVVDSLCCVSTLAASAIESSVNSKDQFYPTKRKKNGKIFRDG
jgi:hypothetical protein